MTGLLIDSHILIWALFEKDRLSSSTQATLLAASDTKVSMASLWELAIKHSKGKLTYSPDLIAGGVELLGASWLELTPAQILQLPKVVIHHLDPFDQMLVSQAITEGLPLLTCDREILTINQPGLSLIDGRL